MHFEQGFDAGFDPTVSRFLRKLLDFILAHVVKWIT
jgi:hypothetical protein